MAKQPSPSVEEIQLRKRARRRLVGAITLVAVMVTVLPMVLDDEPKPVGQDIAINIPSPKINDFPIQAAQPPAQQAQPAQRAAPPQPAAVEQEKHAAPPSKVSEAGPAPQKQEDKPAGKPKAVADKPKEPRPADKVAEPQHAGGGYVVLLGAFLSDTNAKQRQARLKELGIKSYVEKIKSPAGEKTGVRAGPYPSRQEAEHVLAKLKAAGVQDGLVAEKK